MIADILERIVAQRRNRISAAGRAQGLDLPAERAALPIVPFPGPIICEMKRRSPSRGDLAVDADPVERARRYRAAGAESVSVLTEEDHFSGSLVDLIAVKQAFPDLAVLRKDFLLDVEDVEVSWRAGADAVLLIAAILDADTLKAMLAEAGRLGIAALVEIHDEEELRRIAPLRPALVGINSRDLRTFRVDLLEPLALADRIDWECRLVYESGIFHREDVRLARDGGFSSVLVGEAVVRDPDRVALLVAEMTASAARGVAGNVTEGVAGNVTEGVPGHSPAFWSAIARARRIPAAQGPPGPRAGGEKRPHAGGPGRPPGPQGGEMARPHAGGPGRPLVKICGITNLADARLARDLGADILGLIYARSPRTAPEGLARELRRGGIDLPLVGVVVEPGVPSSEDARVTADASPAASAAADGSGDSAVSAVDDAAREGAEEAAIENASLLGRAQRDLAAGDLSALQLHGDSEPEALLDYGWPAYSAVRFRSAAEAREIVPRLRSPRFLIDAYDPAAPGGTGHTVSQEVLTAVLEALAERPHGELWLAGGLNPETVEDAIVAWRPELIDASSGLEAEKGKKDPEKMRRYFAAIDRAEQRLSHTDGGEPKSAVTGKEQKR